MAIGKFISFEGIDGSGLTTQAERLKGWFDKQNRLAYLTKEPTDGPAGAIIRLALSKRLLSPRNRINTSDQDLSSLDAATMALLFAADRMDHVITDIQPKLDKGISVIADRYWLSSFAYQTVELELEWVRQINSRALSPDLTIFLDVPVEIAKKRMDAQRWHVELFEESEKLSKVRNNYLQCIRKLQTEGQKIFIVDGNSLIEVVHKNIVPIVRKLYSTSFGENSGQLDLIENVESELPS